ncbi:hypothetical protein BH09BAC2_BH09BAC2_01940 [soil metagenome]
MATTTTTRKTTTKEPVMPLFSKDNYMWMAIGLVVLALGFLLMAGGKSADPKVFNDSDVYSFRRITLAPILIIAGLVIEIFAIMKKPK